MNFKTLEIFGFKSFAEKIKLSFSPGITAIVGPNGCGKSNIAEAIRWVLGEQSAKSLRGSKMPDVIFSGTSNTTTRKGRAPLPYCEVSITFTDVAGELPLPYEELCVTRRLHRSGESEYFINRQSVRLKDIHSLFLGSGLGKNALSVFEQGKIDQVIHYTPQERRLIFEEVAGISRLVQKRAEALRKLEQLDINLERVGDIVNEIARQIAVSEKQAAAAHVYKEAKQRCELLEKGRLVTKWQQIEQRRGETAQKEELQEEQLLAQNEQVKATQQAIFEKRQELPRWEMALQASNEAVFKASTAKQLCQQQLLTAKELLDELSNKQKKWQQELQHCALQRIQAQQEEEQLLERQELLDSQALSAQQALSRCHAAVEYASEELAAKRQQYQQQQSELVKLMYEEKAAESEIKQISTKMESWVERLKSLSLRQDKLTRSSTELAAEISAKKIVVSNLIEKVDKKRGLLERLELHINEIDSEAKELGSTRDGLRKLFMEKSARYSVLLQLRAECEGASAGYRTLLSEASKPSSLLYNKVVALAESIQIPKGLENEIALLLRPYTNTLVVADDSVLSHLIDFAKERGLTDFSVISREKLKQHVPLAYPNEWEAVVLPEDSKDPLLVHFMSGIVRAVDIATALRYADDCSISSCRDFEEIFCGSGFTLNRHRVLFQASLGENSAFLREVELKNLELEQAQRQQQLNTLVTRCDELAARRAAIEAEVRQNDQIMRSDEMKLVEENFALQRALNDSEKVHKELEELANEATLAAAQQQQLEMSLEELHKKHSTAKEKVARSRLTVEEKAAELEEKEAIGRREKEQLRAAEELYRRTAAEKQQGEHAQQMARLKKEQAHTSEIRIKGELVQAEEASQGVINKQQGSTASLEELISALATAEQQRLVSEQLVSEKKNEISRTEELLQQQRRKNKQAEQERHHLGILAAQLATAQKALEEELLAHFAIDISSACQQGLSLQVSLAAAEEEIAMLRKHIEEAGNVNLAAIEECQQHKERKMHLTAQVDDLQLGKDELRQIITQLEQESRHLFSDTFTLIRQAFKKNFQILFNGGEADLTLINSEDLLQCGIEISAQPPGKQMRSIQLLSGGEKCLTSMALLFAIFEIKPAPFCILDEIDAPLDDANVQRFADVVKQFIDRSQFIVITHNKRTMAMADVLFGVSMEERGVSKVLSMEFAREPGQCAVLV